MTGIELNSTTGGVWDTVPQGSWAVLGVIRNGQRLNPNDEALSDAVAGKVHYDLYAGDYGYFGAAHTFVAKVSFADGSTVTSGQAAAGPGQATTSKPTTTTSTPAANEPNTHQSIPDFWVALSASVITKNTLGLGRDLALTAGATNNQVLTVTVLERATGCMIQGATVEIRDPQGSFVPGTRFQTRGGIIDIGGLRFQKAGLYHLWIHADDAAGKIVMQGYLPLQVVGRKGQPFETLNGRQFTYSGGQWLEGQRSTASAFQRAAVAGNPFEAFVSAFQQLLAGISHSSVGSAQKAKAAQAVTILKTPKASTPANVLQVQAKTGLVPAYLVTSAAQAAEARAANVTPVKVKLITERRRLPDHERRRQPDHQRRRLPDHQRRRLAAGGRREHRLDVRLRRGQSRPLPAVGIQPDRRVPRRLQERRPGQDPDRRTAALSSPRRTARSLRARS